MSKNIDLKKIEKKAWTAYFQDGLWDIFMASMMLTMAIRTLTDNVWFTLGMFSGVPILILGKRFVTIPRLGFVKFSQFRTERRIKLFVSIGIAICATVGILLLISQGWEIPRIVSSLGMAIFLALTFCLIAYYLDFPRLIIYGLMFAVNEIIWGQFGEPTGPYVVLIFGITVMVVGLLFLISFIRKYPLPKEEEIANAS
ncbi:MAG: hypothetical protein JSV56_03705 [Methanomassiliicoccales archaeon]|nr:MAG: hypothetical protein JSV56_03705 [Methanomassiliicoccales archaeon]